MSASIFDNMNTVVTEQNPHAPSKEFINHKFYTPILKKDGKELELWKPALGPNFFDLIPFKMATDKWDRVDINNAKNTIRTKGSVVFDIIVDVNMRLTQGNTSWDLPSREFFGLDDDPVADEKWRLFKKAKEDFGITGKSSQADKDNCKTFQRAKSLFPSTRSLYIVAVYDPEIVAYNRNPKNTEKKKYKKTFHLFAPAYHTFGRLLEEKKSDEMKIGNDINWGHPTEGPTIFIDGKAGSWKDSSGTSRDMIDYKSIAIMPRLEKYPLDIIDKVPSLDEYIIVPTGDEVYKALFGVERKANAVDAESNDEEEEDEGLSFSSNSYEDEEEEDNSDDFDSDSDNGSYEDDIPF